MEEPALQKTFKVKKFERGMNTSSFSCGNPALDEWLKKYAGQSQTAGSASVFIVTYGEEIAGYYALCPANISTSEVIRKIARGQPRSRPIPAIKIARFAVDKNMQGIGLGKALLKDALLRCAGAAAEIGGRAVIVDTIDEDVQSFYSKYGFESGPENSNTMMLLMADIKLMLE